MYPDIQISDIFSIPTYLLIISWDCIFLLFYFNRRIQQPKFRTLDVRLGFDVCLIILTLGLIGGRSAHVLLEAPDFYINNPLKIFDVFSGGFVFFGGLIFSIFGSYLFLKLKKENFWIWADFFAPIGAIGYSLGRIGCFMAGCCFGIEASKNVRWSIVNSTLNDGIHRHPTQLYATLLELVIFIILIAVEHFKYSDSSLKCNLNLNLKFNEVLTRYLHKPGNIFLTWLILHGTSRLFIENYRGDFRGFVIYGYSISTLISLGIIVISLLLIFSKTKLNRKS